MMNVGNPAPPMPVMPAFFTFSTISSGVSSGCSASVSSLSERSMDSSHSSPSTLMMMDGLRYPVASMALSILSTVPETEEKMGAETKPPASAIIVPTFTLSPRATTGLAGAPMCCESGKTACAGNAAGVVFTSDDSLFSSGCTPPMLNVRSFMLFPPFLLVGVLLLASPWTHRVSPLCRRAVPWWLPEPLAPPASPSSVGSCRR